jgi:hypothetical protein
MVVTGLEMRSTSRAGDDETPSKRAGTSKTTVISVHRLAPLQLRGAIEWRCRTLDVAGVTVVQIYRLKILIQRLSNHFIEEQETPGLSIAIARPKMNKPMIIAFAFRAMIDFPFVRSNGISQLGFSALQFFRSIGMPELSCSL